MISACACMGNHYYGEPECPCRMKSMGLPRSQKWHDEQIPEFQAAKEKEFKDALTKVFNIMSLGEST